METIFTDVFYEFLNNYKPVSRMFTSEDEIDLISKTLNLSELDDEGRCRTRNEVVRYYTEMMDGEIIYDENNEYKYRTDKYWDLINSMQSVTTVIDYYKYKK